MELLDVYTKDGKITGRVIERSKDNSSKLGPNEYVAIAQIFIENDKGEFLIEKSAKKTGNRYLPTGGHVDHGETPDTTIIREVNEEIGLDLTKHNFVSLGFIANDVRLRYIYYLKENIDVNDLKLQNEEVESISYMSIKKIQSLIKDGLMHPSHDVIIKKIQEYKNNQ